MKVTDSGIFPDLRRSAPGTVVLQASIDVVGVIIIHPDMIELGQRQVADKTPGFAAVSADCNSTVITYDQVFRVRWIDP